MNKYYFYIEDQEQLKNPVLCYIVMRQWMDVTGEDLIDYNENLVDGSKILQWMLEKSYITLEKFNNITSKQECFIQDLLLGYETGVLYYGGEISFLKAYQVIAEYISENEEIRKEFIYLFCESFSEEIRGGMCASYDEENHHTIYSKIEKHDLQTGTIAKENLKGLTDKFYELHSFLDEYNILKEITFEDCNNIDKED